MKIISGLTAAAISVALIWAIFLIDAVLPLDLRGLGIRPRSLFGLWGIPLAPFLHANLHHIIANSGALFVLLALSFSYSRKLTAGALVIIIFLGGGLVWLLGGSNTVHVGASGVVFGLIGFLIFAGYWRRDWLALLIGAVVLFLYGGVILSGFVPHQGISAISHVFGFVAGAAAAWVTGAAKKE